MNSILVSSTNNIGTESLFIILIKSFICNRNSSGPRMDPCGTLCLIVDHLENVLLLYFLLFIDAL